VSCRIFWKALDNFERDSNAVSFHPYSFQFDYNLAQYPLCFMSTASTDPMENPDYQPQYELHMRSRGTSNAVQKAE